MWLPAAELYGIQRIEYLDDVLGVGGGSHVYGNTPVYDVQEVEGSIQIRA